MKISAACENGHTRVGMYESHTDKKYVCPICHEDVGVDRIMNMIPSQYRPAVDAFAATLQGLLDYDILAVVSPGRQISIEYPRQTTTQE